MLSPYHTVHDNEQEEFKTRDLLNIVSSKSIDLKMQEKKAFLNGLYEETFKSLKNIIINAIYHSRTTDNWIFNYDKQISNAKTTIS